MALLRWKRRQCNLLPTVKITDDISVQCSVCLDEFDPWAEAKEMPCKHKSHSDCILPWLDVHSSCPVCCYQMPVDEAKVDQDDVSRPGIMRRLRDRMEERERERESTRDARVYGGDREEAGGSRSSEYAGQTEGGGSIVPNATSSIGRGDVNGRNENVKRFLLPWPFNGLFSSLTGSGTTPSTFGNDHGSTSHGEDS